jgi:hypothetical protein
MHDPTDLTHIPLPAPEKQQFWPPPDTPYQEPVMVEVEGTIVMRVETSAKSGQVLFVTILAAGGELILHRFQMPNHTRFVRDFFKAAGIKSVPRHTDRFEINGLFPITIEGEVIGEDSIPEEIPKDQRPTKVFVMGKVNARRLLVA